MTTRNKYTTEEILKSYTEHNCNAAAAARSLGVKPRTYQHWINKIPPERFNGVRDASNTIKARNAQLSANKTRKDNQDLIHYINSSKTFQEALDISVKNINKNSGKSNIASVPQDKNKTPMTLELLLSDIQIGKLGDDYNSDVCKQRLIEWCGSVILKVQQYTKHYNIERIVLAILGDIIESDKKHSNSARATDIGTAEQISLAIEYLYEYILKPLNALGIQMDVIAVTGNHDHDEHGLNMFKPGVNHLSYPLYTALKKLTEVTGMQNISWDIPEGMHTAVQIYGSNILYEHGVGVKVSEEALFKRMSERSYQVGKHFSMIRIGDKHTVSLFKGGELCVNGAFFGTDKTGSEFSSILGFSNRPMQVMFSHVPRKDSRSTLFENFCIQLDHVNICK